MAKAATAPKKNGSSLPTDFKPESPDLMPQRWKNRIVGFEPAVDPSTLLANPENWRIHPRTQQEVLEGVFDEVGFVGGIIVNDRTSRIVDGHLRAMLAHRHGQMLPVTHIDISEAEERIILATFDPIGSMASTDLEKMRDLIGEIPLDDIANAAVASTLAQMADSASETLAKMEAKNNETISDTVDTNPDLTGSPILGLVEDAVFPGHGLELIIKGDFGIPAMKPEMIALEKDVPTEVWDGAAPIEQPTSKYLMVYGAYAHPPQVKGATLCFYVEDERFDVVWNDAVRMIAKLKQAAYSSVGAPDFSLWYGDPTALHIYNVYRAAWCARYWQEVGIRVMPNLSWSWPELYDICNKHIPRGCDAVMVQVRTFRAKDDLENRRLQTENLKYHLNYLEPKNVVIYGGADHPWLQTAGLPVGPKYHFLDSFMGARQKHGLLNRGKKEKVKV